MFVNPGAGHIADFRDYLFVGPYGALQNVEPVVASNDDVQGRGTVRLEARAKKIEFRQAVAITLYEQAG